MMYLRGATTKIVNKRRGFGLLETLLATAIFIVVVGSLVSLSRLALRNAILSSHRTQAVNLAEDSLEGIRQLRDTNWLNSAIGLGESDRWKAFVHNCDTDSANQPTGVDCGNESAYQVPILSTAAAPAKYRLAFDPQLNRFAVKLSTVNDNPIILETLPTGAVDSKAPHYDRFITFETVPDGSLALSQITNGAASLRSDGIESVQAIKITSTVNWSDFDKPWSVSTSTILTNWKGK